MERQVTNTKKTSGISVRRRCAGVKRGQRRCRFLFRRRRHTSCQLANLSCALAGGDRTPLLSGARLFFRPLQDFSVENEIVLHTTRREARQRAHAAPSRGSQVPALAPLARGCVSCVALGRRQRSLKIAHRWVFQGRMCLKSRPRDTGWGSLNHL